MKQAANCDAGSNNFLNQSSSLRVASVLMALASALFLMGCASSAFAAGSSSNSGGDSASGKARRPGAQFEWSWENGQLVLTKEPGSCADGLQPGDRVLKINGIPIGQAIAGAEQQFSQIADPDDKREMAIQSLFDLGAQPFVFLLVQHGDALPYFYSLKPGCTSGY